MQSFASLLIVLAGFRFCSCMQILDGFNEGFGPSNGHIVMADLFHDYMEKHGRTYEKGSPEYHERLGYFSNAHAQVIRLNRRPDTLWKAAVNSLSDRSRAEIKQLNGLRFAGRRGQPNAAPVSSLQRLRTPRAQVELKEQVDWTHLSSLFMRNQGACGSCWAVATTTVLAAHSELHGTNTTFSTEQIVNCAPNPHHCGGSGGCDGSTVELGLQYAMNVRVGTPEEYGLYTASNQPCKVETDSDILSQVATFSAGPMVHRAAHHAAGRQLAMTGWEKLAQNQYMPLMTAVNDGPVAVSVAATYFQMYGSGIFNECSDSVTGSDDWVVNHAVTLVGYGKEGDTLYWLVQNSWGEDWGEAGRIRIIRRGQAEETHCGMDERPQDGVACEGEDEPVKVCGSCGILFDSVVPRFSK